MTISKATPYIYMAPTASAITYEKTLGDSTLTGGEVHCNESDNTTLTGEFKWSKPSTKPTVADSEHTTYEVTFIPDDPNYNAVKTNITLVVEKAQIPSSAPDESMDVLFSKKTVKAVELPKGWAWREENVDTPLEIETPCQATAIYVGGDKDNYETTSVVIILTRKDCTHVESEILFTGEGEKEPTCKDAGIGHTECTKCEEPMQSNVEVAATGKHTGGTATCKDKAACEACHEAYGELDKNNHAGKTVVKDEKKATCAVDGYTGDTYCKDCGAKIATGTKIDKSTAHTWDNGVITKEATATEKGEKTYTCSVCKTTKAEEIPALGASEVGTEITSEDGSATYKVTEAGEDGNAVTYEAPTDKNATSVVIPATVTINNITYKVTTISDTAFAGNKKITSVTIGDNITEFSAKTFKGCTNLKTVDVGNGVTSIPANAFKNFKKLTTVKMGTEVETIGKNAFSGCSKLKNLTIGKNVTTISDKSFYKCTSLTKVTIPSKVKTIGKSAFSGCKKLKTVTVGKSVAKIGSKAFYGCSKMKTLTIKSTKLTAKKIGSKAFTKTPKNMTVKVPKKKFEAYKSMLIKCGVNKKAKFKKN